MRDNYDRDKTTTVHQRPFQRRKQTCSAPRPEEPGFVVHRDKLAVWQLPSKVYLLSFLSSLQWTLLRSWLSIACATCCRVVWMQEAGGLPTHDILAHYNRLAAEAPPVVGAYKAVQRQTRERQAIIQSQRDGLQSSSSSDLHVFVRVKSL
jgi:hypothetical protein